MVAAAAAAEKWRGYDKNLRLAVQDERIAHLANMLFDDSKRFRRRCVSIGRNAQHQRRKLGSARLGAGCDGGRIRFVGFLLFPPLFSTPIWVRLARGRDQSWLCASLAEFGEICGTNSMESNWRGRQRRQRRRRAKSLQTKQQQQQHWLKRQTNNQYHYPIIVLPVDSANHSGHT